MSPCMPKPTAALAATQMQAPLNVERPITVLAIDPGSRMGWAVPGESGVIVTTKRKDEEREAWHARLFDRMSEQMAELVAIHRPAVLAIEAPAAGKGSMKGNQAPVALGLRAVIYVIARRHEILIDPVSIATWKAWAKRHGWTEADKADETDALWLRDYWLAVRAPLVSEAA